MREGKKMLKMVIFPPKSILAMYPEIKESTWLLVPDFDKSIILMKEKV